MQTLENNDLLVEIAPEVGAKIVRFVHKASGYDFLWRNENLTLRRESPGAEYDPNFYGGIDELLPNDVPEGDLPDHGELWTAAFEVLEQGDSLRLRALLPIVQFRVTKRIALEGNALLVTTEIENVGAEGKSFLWKLHAALAIQPGDEITCATERYSAADPDWSRRGGEGVWTGEIVPEFDNTTEFLYLHPVSEGRMAWTNGAQTFSVRFDPKVFQYCWYFASYGGFLGHKVAILEPCTAMPMALSEASALGQCAFLDPGERLATTYRFEAL